MVCKFVFFSGDDEQVKAIGLDNDKLCYISDYFIYFLRLFCVILFEFCKLVEIFIFDEDFGKMLFFFELLAISLFLYDLF